jgi:hypothetical protein
MQDSRFTPLRFLPLALVALLAACSSGGSISMLTTIAGGEKIAVPLGPRGVEPSKKDGVQIELATCTLNRDKKLVYAFELSDERKRAVRRVRVEDVSDASSALLVDDTQPALTQNRWRGSSRPFEPGDPSLAWLATITNSVRVYRFTVTFADGHEVALLQGSMFPNFIKSSIRQTWGEKY